MSKTIFSRRLGSDETEIWMDLLKERTHASQSEDLVVSFSNLENGMLYISSIEDSAFGGSAVYIDRYRLGMALVDIIIKPQYIDETSYVVIKSSMPYFRSLSIKNVDVLVNSSNAAYDIPFPLAFSVDPCMIGALEKIGFEPVYDLYHVTINGISEVPRIEHNLTMNSSIDTERCLKFYWSVHKHAGVDCSHFWCAFDIFMQRNRLHTISNNDGIIAIFGYDSFDKLMVVAPFLIDAKLVSPDQMVSLLFSNTDTKSSRLDFPIIGTGQLDYIQQIAEILSGEISTREIQLMRKRL